MNNQEFRNAAQQLAEYIADYRDNIADRRVIPQVKPGFLKDLIPLEPPMEPQPWSDVMKDMDKVIMPGLSHWQHPYFHAYFANGATFPGILSDMVAGAMGVNVTSWIACPVATELEMNVLDWFARALDLPKEFMFSEPNSTGGGMHTTSASESILCAMLAARAQALAYLKQKNKNPNIDESELLPQLVLYCSVETHSCVEKAAMIGLVQLRILDIDEKCSLRGETVKKAIDADIAKGLLPFFVVATVGTTGSTAIDNVAEIAAITKDLPSCWLHVDGAYGGSSFSCPELRGPMKGFEHIDSFNFNPNKWFLITPESSCLFVRDRKKLQSSLVEDTTLYDNDQEYTPEYRHWSVALGRRFRALQVWMTLKSLGLDAIQECIRNHCKMAKLFESHVKKDDRFEVMNDVKLSCVTFRLKGENGLTEKLLDDVNNAGKIHMIPSMTRGKYVIRYVSCYRFATKEHVDFGWNEIQSKADAILAANKSKPAVEPATTMAFVQEVDEKEMNSTRGKLTDFAKPIDKKRVNDSKANNEQKSADESMGITGKIMTALNINH